MGLILKWLGIGGSVQEVGNAIESVAEVFTVNKTKSELAVRAQAMASLGQYGAEFTNANTGWFDSFINGLNRLPRPVMALGTVGLFVFAMASPEGFAARMQGLAYIPDPLWWLLGVIVSFYLGRGIRSKRRNSSVKSSAAWPLFLRSWTISRRSGPCAPMTLLWRAQAPRRT